MHFDGIIETNRRDVNIRSPDALLSRWQKPRSGTVAGGGKPRLPFLSTRLTFQGTESNLSENPEQGCVSVKKGPQKRLGR